MLDAKDPSETVTVTFDYTSRFASITSAQIFVELVSGTDPTPETIISGSPVIQRGQVYQNFTAGVNGCTYRIKCLALMPDGQQILIIEQLPVKVLTKT